jgi:RimJ/RimL family protein N-acetyltransferase
VTEPDAHVPDVPTRIEIDDGFVLREYVDTDMPALVTVVNANLDHLRPFMPWAQQPTTLEGQTQWWRDASRISDGGRDFPFGIFAPDGRIVGGAGFHARSGPGVLEIGYWLAADATGHGLMTRVVSALVGTAGRLDGVRRLEIKCDETNTRSAAVALRLGFVLSRVEAREPAAAAETGRQQVWVLDIG